MILIFFNINTKIQRFDGFDNLLKTFERKKTAQQNL